MIERVNSELLANECDKLLTMLINDEKKYNEFIKEEIIVRDYFKEMIKNKNHILLCYKIDNKVVGYLFLKYLNNDDGIGYLIDGLYVLEDYRNKSIGKSLIKEGLNIVNTIKHDYIDVSVMYQNEIAKSLYKSFGFDEFSLRFRKKD